MSVRDDFEAMLNSPEVKAEMARIKARDQLARRLTSWMGRIPVLGYYVSSFWFLIITEGVYQTCKPRWGGITFSFLNDGQGATLWHTWHSMTDPQGKYAGIYTTGAPSSLEQARRWEFTFAWRAAVRETLIKQGMDPERAYDDVVKRYPLP